MYSYSFPEKPAGHIPQGLLDSFNTLMPMITAKKEPTVDSKKKPPQQWKENCNG